MSIQYTKDDLVRHVRAYFRKQTPDGVLTAHDDEIITDSVAAAIMAVFHDYSMDDWRFNIQEVSSTMTEDVAYVDITSETYEILSVMSDTVRISSPIALLQTVPKDQIYSIDPNYEQKGLPQLYSVERATYDSQNANNIRIYFWPVPDANYAVNLSLTVARNEGIETKIPSFLSIPLKTKAVSIAARWLGSMNEVENFDIIYNRDLQRWHTNNNTDKPKHIPNLHGIL